LFYYYIGERHLIIYRVVIIKIPFFDVQINRYHMQARGHNCNTTCWKVSCI